MILSALRSTHRAPRSCSIQAARSEGIAPSAAGAWRSVRAGLAVLLMGAGALLVACPGGGGKLPIGAICNENEQCASGTCFDNVCVLPGGHQGGTCSEVRGPLEGTCAQALGRAVAECWDPEGCYSLEDGFGGESIVWENGARMALDEAEVVTFFSSSGVICFIGEEVGGPEERADERAEEVSRMTVPGEGTWEITTVDGDATVIRCESGTELVLTEEDVANLEACSSFEGFELCPLPGMCESVADCGEGEVCCDFGGFSFCAPVEACS